MEENVHTWDYSIKKGYTVDYRKKHPLYFSFDDITINDNLAIVQVDIDGDKIDLTPQITIQTEVKEEPNMFLD